jgi:hypothetical protein
VSSARAARPTKQNTAQSVLTVRRRQFEFINANIAARGHASILSDSPLVTIWAAKAGQRRSSYTVPGSGAVISQAAVTRLASLKRAPISADSLGENLVFGKSANDKKVPDGVDSDPYIEMSTKAALRVQSPGTLRLRESRAGINCAP